MKPVTKNGFTLIELLIALAIAAVLLGIGIPSFSGAIKNSQVSADYNEIVQALFLARSESVKSREFVTVCPKAAQDSEQCGTTSAHWKNGWLVFIDSTNTIGEATATVDPTDEIISIHPEPRSDNEIIALGSTNRTRNTASIRNYIRYTPTGESEWANGSFLFCNDEAIEYSRVINVAPTGDIRQGRASGSEYPRNVFNEEACT